MTSHDSDREMTVPKPEGMAAVSTEVPAAYFHYVSGIDYRTRTSPDLRKALRQFEQATTVDPQFTEAYVQLCQIHSYLYFNGDPGEARKHQALAALERTLELDPDLPAVRITAAKLKCSIESDYEGALETYDELARQQPLDPEVTIGRGYAKRLQGKLDEALDLLVEGFRTDRATRQAGGDLSFARAQATLALSIAETFRAKRDYPSADRWYSVAQGMNPENPYALGQRAMNLLDWKSSNEPHAPRAAIESARRLLADSPMQRDEPLLRYRFLLDFYDSELALETEAYDLLSAVADGMSHLNKGKGSSNFFDLGLEASVRERLGQLDRSKILVRSICEQLEEQDASGRASPKELALLGVAQAYLGRREEGLANGERAAEQSTKDAFNGPQVREYVAAAFAFAEAYDRAIDILAELRTTTYKQAISAIDLQVCPLWSKIRNHPRFHDLLARRSTGET